MRLYLSVNKVSEDTFIAAVTDNRPDGFKEIWLVDNSADGKPTLSRALLLAIKDLLGVLQARMIMDCELVISNSFVCSWLAFDSGGKVNRNYIVLLEDIQTYIQTYLYSFKVVFSYADNYADGLATLDNLRMSQEAKLMSMLDYE